MISVHLNKQNAFQGRLYAFELFYTMFMSLEKKDSYSHQVCLCLIKNTVKSIIMWKNITI